MKQKELGVTKRLGSTYKISKVGSPIDCGVPQLKKELNYPSRFKPM
jgi:hypothetical protein